ncbi:uncharacterized protein MONBRDRAFT_27986 [Monosiga brevicollis MX1]|uniref:Guanylate cyclase n=1 Tax=Monosiga brevicollis TaxID=81824 RepID=A9V6V9_MONBE|nr:uncharacterized protein MONBRDRAFT_27986 [Monosiga brevicollis MX1]EDQ86612.1 predicted protein [Monosiga brevicollis MX1]|eukprot:XP_001748448.1 hypothetical protein [Monosiga brevicollis MX1]
MATHQRRPCPWLLVWALALSCTLPIIDGLRLRFDPTHSPPSEAEALADPERYRAYNRAVLSRNLKPLRVRIEDDSGNLVTTGPDSELVLQFTSAAYYPTYGPLPDEVAAVANLTALGKERLFKRVTGAQHTFDLVEHSSMIDSAVSIQARAGIAELYSWASVPTVYVSNETTNFPFVAGAPVLLNGVCCKNIWEVVPSNLLKASAIQSNPYHVFPRAEFLALASPMPARVLTDEVLPDIEVRVMTYDYVNRDALDQPRPMPLLHGPDVDMLDIQLTIAYEHKVFAATSPNASSINVEGMDISPLFYSAFDLYGDGVAQTARDDWAVRQRVSLLPSGHYGVIFRGIHFKQLAATGIRLNITMSHIGGRDFFNDINRGFSRAAAFTRAGLGMYELQNLTSKQLWNERDPHPLTPKWDYLAIQDLHPKIYQGYETNLVRLSHAVAPNGFACTNLTEPRRQAWCQQSALTVDPAMAAGPGVLITSPILVEGRSLDHLSITWARQATDPPEVQTQELFDDLLVQAYDADGKQIVAGPHASLVVDVAAYELNSDNVSDIKGSAAICNAWESFALPLANGEARFPYGICGLYPWVALRFAVTAGNITSAVWTQPFTVNGLLPVAVMLPEADTASPYELPYRAYKMLMEQQIVGVAGNGPDPQELGPYYPNWRYVPIYIDSRGEPFEVIQRLDKLHQQHHFRYAIGPFRDEIGTSFAEWVSHNIRSQFALSIRSNLQALGDAQRFPNIWRMAFADEMYWVTLVESMVNRKWSLVTLVQSVSAPFPNDFLDLLRLNGIQILLNVQINSEDSSAELLSQLETIHHAAGRVILANLDANDATRVFTQAVMSNVTAQAGYQWVGTETTFRALDLLQVPDAATAFEGACFLTAMYGLGPAANSRQVGAVSDWQLRRNLGGLDPFWVRDEDFRLEEANMWQFGEAMLANDVFFFVGFAHAAMLNNGLTGTTEFVNGLHSYVEDLALYSGSDVNFNVNCDRIGFVGVWAQPKASFRVDDNASSEFVPWDIRGAVEKADVDEPLIELDFIDPRTLVTAPSLSYAASVTQTTARVRTKARLSKSEVVFYREIVVPVTHTCAGGCGGGLRNASVSAYIYEHGTCVAPERCECIMRADEPEKPAFFGTTCASALCDHSCRNGICLYDAVQGETACNCEAGWGGDDCSVAQCAQFGCVQAQGDCELPDVCVCREGFFGADCGEACLCGHGECHDGNRGTGTCTCEAGYFGVDCARACTCVHGMCNDGASGNGMCASCSSGWMGENCDLQVAAVAVPILLGAGSLCIGLLLLGRWYVRMAKHRALLDDMDWVVPWDDVQTSETRDNESSSQRHKSVQFQSALSLGTQGSRQLALSDRVARYRGALVQLEPIYCKSMEVNMGLRRDIRALREAHHPNLMSFVGMCVQAPHTALLFEYCQKGSLEDMLAHEDVRLDETFKFSMLKDIAAGLRYLHQSELRYHGKLCSRNCYIDNRWTVKLSGFGMQQALAHQNAVCPENNMLDFPSLRWTAPELLIPGLTRLNDLLYGSQAGDIFSFGVLMSEVWTREQPYDDSTLSGQEIIAQLGGFSAQSRIGTAVIKQAWAVKDGMSGESRTDELRPTIYAGTPQPLGALMRRCWAQNAEERPALKDVMRDLAVIHPVKGSMVDNLVRMLEKYSQDLEGIVSERTAELAQEKEKVETLVHRMLPKAIVEKLKDGQGVKAESFDEVTIFFSGTPLDGYRDGMRLDIVGFTRICSMSTPLQVVDMLNDLYTCFDAIIDEYDVYKVETIGDAYMVVSGLPTRNGKKHAGEIASMALHMLSEIVNFRIRHLPLERLQLRVGLHSGPVVAGVVGTKMPRYCLFGDTVNIASRMESGGFALRVHLSDTTAQLLKELGGYDLELRGQREVKGRGQMCTYWLNGKQGFNRPLPSADMRVSASQHEFK